MRKRLLVTAALMAAVAVSAVSGAGTASASTGTGTKFCVGKTCVYQSDYANYPLTIPYAGFISNGTTMTAGTATAEVGHWTGAYYAPQGTCQASKSGYYCIGNAGATTWALPDSTEQVQSIFFPVDGTAANPSGYFTCLEIQYAVPVNGIPRGGAIFLLSAPASPGTWVQNNIESCTPGTGIKP